MPKNKRGKRKTRKWRKLDTGVENNASKMIERELHEAKAKKNFFVDNTAGDQQEFTPAQRKQIARSKVLTVEKLINPFPHIGASFPPQQKRKRSTSIGEGGSKRPKLTTESGGGGGRGGGTQENRNVEEEKFYDLWAPPEDPIKKISEEYPEVEPDYFTVPQTISRPYMKPPSSLPAIQAPHPGTSYNPALDQYLVLLNMAVEEQMKKRRALKRVINALKGVKLTHKVKEADDIVDLAKMTEEERLEEEEEEGKEEEEGDTPKVYQAHVPRKTRTERNAISRKNRNRVQALLKMNQEEREKRLGRLEEILQEVLEKEKRIREKITRTEEKKKLQSEETLRLGKEKYTDPEIDVLLPDQLPKRLAHYSTYKNNINPMLDHIASIQKRNIIEYRSKKIRRPRRFSSTTFVEKFSHKAFTNTQQTKYEDL